MFDLSCFNHEIKSRSRSDLAYSIFMKVTFMNYLSKYLTKPATKQFLSTVIAASAFCFSTGFATAQTAFPAYGSPISLENARTLIAAAKVEAAKNKWNLAIAVVDTSGAIVAMERMDDTLLISAQLAVDKARSANGFKRSTKVLQDIVTSGFTPLLSLQGATAVEGGVPIIQGGKIVGAIGVSGANANEDGKVAAAGLAALK
jgi:glc operon protein GlcG